MFLYITFALSGGYSFLNCNNKEMGNYDNYVEIFLTSTSVLSVIAYCYVYIISKSQYGDKYLPILTTGRTLVLAGFLLYFYNPLRNKFEYGRSMPFFAFSAGLTLLFLLKKYDILNFVHFILYVKLLPEDSSIDVCKQA
jgi:hypothetical protein